MIVNPKNTWREKFKRTLTAVLPVDEKRIGTCNRCGECCNLPTRCPFLGYDEEGFSTCKVYKYRPVNCRKYPRSSAEQICPSCSYSFLDSKEGCIPT